MEMNHAPSTPKGPRMAIARCEIAPNAFMLCSTFKQQMSAIEWVLKVSQPLEIKKKKLPLTSGDENEHKLQQKWEDTAAGC